MADDTADTLRIISATKLINKYDSMVYELNRFEYNSLKNSIASDKVQSPIVINQNNVILDGHHRVKICRELGIENVPVLIKNFDSELEERFFVKSTNLLRRQFNDFVKAEEVVELAKIESERASQRQRHGGLAPNGAKGKTSEIIAEQVGGLSPRTYERAVFVMKHADPEIKEKLRKGELSISASYNYYIRKEKRGELQAQVLSSKAASTDKVTVILGDFREKCKTIHDNSIALIFTDPPYEKEYLGLYKDLGEVASRVLVDGGSLFTFFNQQYLRQVYDSLESSGLSHHWIFAVIHSGGTTSAHPQQIRVTWKPLLWFRNGPKLRTPDYIEDSVISEPPDKDADDWAQSKVETGHVISKLTVEGDTVLDPCMGGSCSTGIASLELNRKFIGIDIDEKKYNSAKNNLGKLV